MCAPGFAHVLIPSNLSEAIFASISAHLAVSCLSYCSIYCVFFRFTRQMEHSSFPYFSKKSFSNFHNGHELSSWDGTTEHFTPEKTSWQHVIVADVSSTSYAFFGRTQ